MKRNSRRCTSCSTARHTTTSASGSREAAEDRPRRPATLGQACSTVAAAGTTLATLANPKPMSASGSSFPMRRRTPREDKQAAAGHTVRDRETFKKAITQRCLRTATGKRTANTARATDTAKVPFKTSIPIGFSNNPKCSIGNLMIIMSKGNQSDSQLAPIITTHSMTISRRITPRIPTIRTKCHWWPDLPSTSTPTGASQCRATATAISREPAPCMAAIPPPRSARLPSLRRAGTGAAAMALVVIRRQKASDIKITNNFDDLII